MPWNVSFSITGKAPVTRVISGHRTMRAWGLTHLKDLVGGLLDLRRLEPWMDGWVDGWMDGRTDGWMDGWMDGCTKQVSQRT